MSFLNGRFEVFSIAAKWQTAFDAAAQNTETAAQMDGGTRYSYEALASKQNMPVTQVASKIGYAANKEGRRQLVQDAIQNAAAVGWRNSQGNAVVRVNDTGADIILSAAGLRHGLDRRFSVNAPVTLKAGEILQNAVQVNELTPKKNGIDASYVLIGVAKNENNEPYIVQFVVNRATNEVMSVDVLYSVNAKKEPAALLPEIAGMPATLTGSDISIEQLLKYVNRYFPDVLPMDVLSHYGHTQRPAGVLGESARYSLKNSSDVEYLPPEEITPMNDITNSEMYEYLEDDIRRNGYNGRPILAYETPYGHQALTGSHRTMAPKSTLGKALHYLKEQWPYLRTVGWN